MKEQPKDKSMQTIDEAIIEALKNAPRIDNYTSEQLREVLDRSISPDESSFYPNSIIAGLSRDSRPKIYSFREEDIKQRDAEEKAKK